MTLCGVGMGDMYYGAWYRNKLLSVQKRGLINLQLCLLTSPILTSSMTQFWFRYKREQWLIFKFVSKWFHICCLPTSDFCKPPVTRTWPKMTKDHRSSPKDHLQSFQESALPTYYSGHQQAKRFRQSWRRRVWRGRSSSGCVASWSSPRSPPTWTRSQPTAPADQPERSFVNVCSADRSWSHNSNNITVSKNGMVL